MSHWVPERSVTPWSNYTKSGPSHPSLPSSKDRSKTNAKGPLASLHCIPPMTPDLYWASLDLLSNSTWFMSVSDKEFFSPDLPPLAYSTPATWGHCSSLCQQASLAFGIFTYSVWGALPPDSSVAFPTSSAPKSLSWGGLSSCTICQTILSTLNLQHLLPFWTYFSISSSRRFLR